MTYMVMQKSEFSFSLANVRISEPLVGCIGRVSSVLSAVNVNVKKFIK